MSKFWSVQASGSIIAFCSYRRLTSSRF